MAVDAFTLVAQIVNFLVLVYLLKRFLYRPVLDVMDRREAAIVGRVQDAEDREAEAQSTIDGFHQKTNELEAKRQQLLARARAEADNERASLLDAARHDIDGTRSAWQRELVREQEELLQDVRSDISHNVSRLTRKVIEDLADGELQDQLVSVLLRRLYALEPEPLNALADSCAAGDAEIAVLCAFSLSTEQRDRVRHALWRLLDKKIDVRFELRPELICGLVLTTPQQEIAWNVDDYLAQLEGYLGQNGSQRQPRPN